MDIFKEMGESQWDSAFQFECDATKEYFRGTVATLKTDAITLQSKQDLLRKIRDSTDTTTIFTDLSKLESKIRAFETTAQKWEKEGQSQILFTQEWSKPFNDIPFVLPAAAIFKKYIFPFFAVLLPLLAWILPLVILRFVFRVPMTFATYKDMMINMWLGGKTWNTLDLWGQARILFQTTWTLFGIFQGVQQPVQQALHIQKMDAMILEQGALLQDFVAKTKECFTFYKSLTGETVKCPYLFEIPVDEARKTYAYVTDHSNDMKWIWKTIAEIEFTYKLGKCEQTCFPKYMQSKLPYFKLQNFYDPSIGKDKRVLSDVSIDQGKHHILVTGPNKGGKSSSLRAICLNIWLAQTIGIAFADKMELVPFDWIRSGLRLVDTPGSESLFERELKFATEILRLSGNPERKGIIFYDECFHSTNPPDGEKTARLFLKAIWETTNVSSIVTTHVFGLLDDAPENVQKLCVPAEKKEGKLFFSFKLTPGICKVSSVEELYTKHGFLTSRQSKCAQTKK